MVNKKITMTDIISHIKQLPTGEWSIQTNDEHSRGVAELARKFAFEFGMEDWGYLLGLLHDKGKEQRAFQQHIRFSSGYDLSAKDKAVDHAYVGALIAKEKYRSFSPLLINEIAGHHRGLYDYGDLEEVMKQAIPEDVSDFELQLNLKLPNMNLGIKDFHHIIRILFSCLVDADYLDTERFMDENQYYLRKNKKSLVDLYKLLEQYLEDLKKNAADTPVNQIRQQVQEACIKESEGETGFYSLTVPTGGGKTLSSLVWAMKHAIKNGKKRIIIAIPYTSIIVQTASILKNIFGEENVLEHHSSTNPELIKNEELREKFKLATENWDYPIVVTTNVQLFESMMENHTSKCRKLHNICNSVLILDEVQTLPIEHLQPIVDSLDTYNRIFGTSVLFTTASQPVLTGNHNGTNPNIKFEGLDNVKEIIPNDMNLPEKLKRVTIESDTESSKYDDIVERLIKHDRVLCIVNTRKDAKEIYDRLPKEGLTLHLSRMMCPKHIMKVIEEIKNSLKDENNKIIRVVTTQLIEAGVDIDFPIVYRQEAGLDSVLQAAGRCNREGRSKDGKTYIFSLTKEHPLPSGHMTQTNNARIALGRDIDWFSQKTMSEYFEQLYCRCTTFDKEHLTNSDKSNISLLYKRQGLMFEAAAEKFRLIEDKTTPIVVQWEDSNSLIEKLKEEGPSYTLMKKISSLSVSINQEDFVYLKKEKLIEEIIEGVWFAPAESQYSKETGLTFENHWLDKIHIV